MRLILLLIIISVNNISFAQKNLRKVAQPIIEEGFKLYESEMASWHGTDLFMDSYPFKEKVGGYFSYTNDLNAICIFFSNEENPKVIGQIMFEKDFDLDKAKIDLNERNFSSNELEIYTLREKAWDIILSDSIFFENYENIRFNLVPLIEKKEKKVYIISGPVISGVVVFGNDYLLTFDKKNNLKSKEKLHQNIIPIYYEENGNNGNPEETFHTHLEDSSEFMTATDICTLLLYQKFTNWKQHFVLSNNYYSFWKPEINEMFIVPRETIDKINEEQKKQNEK